FLGAEWPVRIVAFDDANLDRGRILDSRYPVVEHVRGNHQAFVVAGFFAHGLAHAHPDRALYLAFDRQPVQRPAAVVRNPDFVPGNNAGLLIDADFTDLSRIPVAHSPATGRAPILLAAV